MLCNNDLIFQLQNMMFNYWNVFLIVYKVHFSYCSQEAIDLKNSFQKQETYNEYEKVGIIMT